MFNKRYYNVNEIYNTAMYNTKTYSTIISKSDLSTLKGTNWLCGDVLNIYLSLVKQQSTLKIFAADTYVFTSFSNNRNKTFFSRNKPSLFDYDVVFVPIHVTNNHWAFSTVFVHENCIKYYDSLSKSNYYGLEKCKIVEEFLKSSFNLNSTDFTQWSLENVADTPQQPDGHNCGVYVCQNIKSISRREKFSICPSDLPVIRKEMVAELALGFLFS